MNTCNNFYICDHCGVSEHDQYTFDWWFPRIKPLERHITKHYCPDCKNLTSVRLYIYINQLF